MSSGWLPWSSLATLKLAFIVSSDDRGSHPDDLSVSAEANSEKITKALHYWSFWLRIYRQPAESSHKVSTVYNVSLTWRHHDVLDGHKITQQNKRQQTGNAGPFNLFINILFHMIFASHLGFPNITLNSFWSAQYCMGYPPSSLFICFRFVIVICDGPRTMTSLFNISLYAFRH